MAPVPCQDFHHVLSKIFQIGKNETSFFVVKYDAIITHLEMPDFDTNAGVQEGSRNVEVTSVIRVLHSFGDFSWKGNNIYNRLSRFLDMFWSFQDSNSTNDKKISETSGPQWLLHRLSPHPAETSHPELSPRIFKNVC